MDVRKVSLVLLLLGTVACESTPEVTTDSDPQADFTRYRTYTWVYQDTPQGMNPLTYERTRAAIDRQLTAQGFQEGTPGDFAVAFTLGRRDRVEVTDFGPYGAYYPGYYGWGWADPYYYSRSVRNVTDGTLQIDFYDVQSKRPVWHGLASKTFNSTAAVEQAEIDGAVVLVLAEFPPA